MLHSAQNMEQEFEEVIWLVFHKLFCSFGSSPVLKVERKLPDLCILAKVFLEFSRGFEQKSQRNTQPMHLVTEKSQKSRLQMVGLWFRTSNSILSLGNTLLVGDHCN